MMDARKAASRLKPELTAHAYTHSCSGFSILILACAWDFGAGPIPSFICIGY